jgi:hypothetical protein
LLVPEAESVRVEVAFEGGQLFGASITAESAEALERAVTAGSGGTLALDADDGRITVVVPQVVYVRRFARDERPGFGMS